VQDLSTAHNEYLKVGNMHYTIDSSKYENSFKEVIGRVNSLLSQTTEDIESVADVLGQISETEVKPLHLKPPCLLKAQMPKWNQVLPLQIQQHSLLTGLLEIQAK